MAIIDKWKGEDNVDEAHEQRVDNAAEEAGDGADDRSYDEGEGDADQGDLQVDACAPDDA